MSRWSPPWPNEYLEKEQMTEADRLLLARFQQYEQSQELLNHTLQYWDRVKGRLFMATPTEAPPQDAQDPAPERHAPSGKKSRRERDREKEEREGATSPLGETSEGAETEAPPESVPQILLPVSGREHPSGAENPAEREAAPPGRGVGWAGDRDQKACPFSLPSCTLWCRTRKSEPRPVPQESSTHFTFLAPSVPEDPAEDRKEAETEPETLSSASQAKVRHHASACSIPLPIL
ncbi:hypothetical protein SKAU_G00343330 [Synaphobranchus kaupii]|uniref:Uncharacterized protein n=1 Tax=Synaphobranchus kaupii TaxID=118154 RepID=A0A9Q1EJ46_SYNKA|nr:hypothetical protein SKAU_G00343330 [Synaphobranchus kaupii]